MPVSGTACCGGNQCAKRKVTSSAYPLLPVTANIAVARINGFILLPPSLTLPAAGPSNEVNSDVLAYRQERPLQGFGKLLRIPATGIQPMVGLARVCPY